MKEARPKQKSYADRRQKDIEFSVGDHVSIKASTITGVIRFGKSGKLTPRFVGQFPIVDRIRKLTYRVKLLNSLGGVHDVFHVSHLRKCVENRSLL